MRPPYITSEFLQSFIASALKEDVGDGDHSSIASIPQPSQSQAILKVKADGVLAGVDLATEIFSIIDPMLQIKEALADGALVKKGDIAFAVEGNTRSILLAERLVLNCMQRMSGIATKTRRFCELIAGTAATLLDTRKTTPNFRLIEKWAVLIGGGTNHRMGLFDMVMLKDNHIAGAGGIKNAIFRTKEYLRTLDKKLQIEIEAQTLAEVGEIVSVGGVDVIMLDNMSLSQMREAVRLIDGKFKTEASGGITESVLREVALCGVDYISVGELTHTVTSLDLSLKIVSDNV